jgi:hypothetical protein
MNVAVGALVYLFGIAFLRRRTGSMGAAVGILSLVAIVVAMCAQLASWRVRGESSRS